MKPEAEAALDALVDALAFYGDPETYHAIAFLPDPPCGAFMEDFSDTHGDDFYKRPMPGARARAALKNNGQVLLDALAMPMVQAALADAFREGYRQGAQDEASESEFADNPYRTVPPEGK